MAVIGVGSVDTERVATRWFAFVLNTWPRRILLSTGEAWQEWRKTCQLP